MKMRLELKSLLILIAGDLLQQRATVMVTMKSAMYADMISQYRMYAALK